MEKDDKLKNFIKATVRKLLNESHYDLVSQFKGMHQGNEMPKNEYLNSLGLDESGITTLQDWINLMLSDEAWRSTTYPTGYGYDNVIKDISEVVKDLPNFIAKYNGMNPVKVVNYLKGKISH